MRNISASIKVELVNAQDRSIGLTIRIKPLKHPRPVHHVVCLFFPRWTQEMVKSCESSASEISIWLFYLFC